MTNDAYDLRPLVTTVSYDSLLSRGGQPLVLRIDPYSNAVVGTWDLEQVEAAIKVMVDAGQVPTDELVELRRVLGAEMRKVLIKANQTVYGEDSCPSPLPFEYADYPQSIANATAPGSDNGCNCPTKKSCVFNARKGRLLLSLPWLDQALATGEIDFTQQVNLIQNAFMLMLSRARGSYWDDEAPNGGVCPEGEIASGNVCIDPTLVEWIYDPLYPTVDKAYQTSHRLARISRTAAALTANLLDYVDADDEPSRVPIRSYDFGIYPNRFTAATRVDGGGAGVRVREQPRRSAVRVWRRAPALLFRAGGGV